MCLFPFLILNKNNHPYCVRNKEFSTNISPKFYVLLSSFFEKHQIKPVFIFHNLDINQTRENIRNTVTNLSGIYMIFNNETGDYYIGSASTNRFYTRYCNHLINFTGSKILKNAVKKYGLKNFSFVILELFPEVINRENNKKLLNLEDFYLKSLLPN